MPFNDQLKLMAERRGISIAQLVHETYEAQGTLHKTAVALGVYDNAVRYWLKVWKQQQEPVKA